MGRLQRKKTARKKKKQLDDTASGTAPTGDVEVKTKPMTSASSTSGDAQKGVHLAQKKTAAANRSPNFIEKSIQFLREVRAELKKVTWPSRKQALGSTAVVIVLVMIIAFYLGMVDMGLSSLIRLVLQ